jgi:hypothetical protein
VLAVVARGDDHLDAELAIPLPELLELLLGEGLLRHEVEDLRVVACGLHRGHLAHERLPRRRRREHDQVPRAEEPELLHRALLHGKELGADRLAPDGEHVRRDVVGLQGVDAHAAPHAA